MRVAVVGATGAVGKEMIRTLERHKFPVDELFLYASKRSEGKEIEFMGKRYRVEVLSEANIKSKGEIDVAFFSAGASRSKEFAKYFVEIGAVVIDNSSAFRMDKDVPLVVPEINGEDIKWHKGIIANPNCSTIQMVMALKPIYDEWGIKRVVVATYQAVSGAGEKAMWELKEQSKSILLDEKKELVREKFPHQIAFNCLPHIDVFYDNLFTKEEMKMINETRKIMHDDNIEVLPTCVRVPVFYGHSEAIYVETVKEVDSVDRVREVLSGFGGIKVEDEPFQNVYPMPIKAEFKEEVFVGRIRKDPFRENGLLMFVVADNILKGAALNAIQIAEAMREDGLLG